VTEAMSERVLRLPLDNIMPADEQHRIIDAIQSFVIE
jgi:hypothetical protein